MSTVKFFIKSIIVRGDFPFKCFCWRKLKTPITRFASIEMKREPLIEFSFLTLNGRSLQFCFNEQITFSTVSFRLYFSKASFGVMFSWVVSNTNQPSKQPFVSKKFFSSSSNVLFISLFWIIVSWVMITFSKPVWTCFIFVFFLDLMISLYFFWNFFFFLACWTWNSSLL